MRNEYEYTKAERVSAILDELAARLGITPEDLRMEPEPLAADASPRQIAQHLLDQGVIQPGGSFGCWRPEPFGRWATLPTLAHLAGALERLLDRDISLEVAERIGAHVALHGDVADHRAQAKLFEHVGIR